MDPFSGEGELLNITTAFLRGSYTQVLEYPLSDFSSSNTLAARILQLRARIALGQQSSVLSELKNESTPDLAAVRAFALYSQGKTDQAVKEAEKLIESSPQNHTVQLLGATILQGEGRTEEALGVLAKHEGSLEAVALTTHLHLLLNRPDLAQRETSSARKWAQDSLLVNIAESWLNLRLGGDKYQAAYYVFEEMASTPSSTGTLALVSQAISELHLGRVEEAQAALEQALGRDEGDRDALANLVVLLTVAGKRGEAEEVRGRLEKSGKGKGGEHPLLGDLREKERLFDEVATKWGPKVAS